MDVNRSFSKFVNEHKLYLKLYFPNKNPVVPARVSEWIKKKTKNKTHLYAVYKRLTLDLMMPAD